MSATGALPGPVPPPTGGRRPHLWPSITMLVVGVVAGVVGFALFIAVGLSGILGAVAHQAPVTLTVQCQVGDYYVYQDTGTRQSAGGTSVTTSGEVTMTTADVRVTGPDGNRVATFTGSGAETITIGSAQYADAVGFHASTSGAYLVRIAAVTPSSVVVAPSVGSQFLRAAPWLALAGVGGLLVVGGVAWLVIAIVRRRRTDRPDPWGGPAPPLPPGAVPPGPWLPRNYDPFPAPPPSSGPTAPLSRRVMTLRQARPRSGALGRACTARRGMAPRFPRMGTRAGGWTRSGR